jgi:hypothetical protein
MKSERVVLGEKGVVAKNGGILLANLFATTKLRFLQRRL